MSPECVRFITGKFFLNDSGMTINSKDSRVLNENYLNHYLFINQELIYLCGRGPAQKNIEIDAFNNIQIPLPPKNIQEKILDEISKIEDREEKILKQGVNFKNSIKELLKNKGQLISIENLVSPIESKIIKIQHSECQNSGEYPVISQEKEFIIGYTDKENPIIDVPAVVFGDHNCFFKYVDFPFFQGADGIKILKPNMNKILPKFFFYSLQDLKIENADKYMRHYSYLRVKKIAVPAIEDQQKIVKKIEKIEKQISKINKELEEVINEKRKILKKYL